MLRELRRFNVSDVHGRKYELVEVAAFRRVGDEEILNGVPTLMTVDGALVVKADAPGAYVIERHRLSVRES